MHKSYLTPLIIFALAGHVFAHDLEFVRVADDNRSFALEKSGRKFVPWGFNYDHGGDGELLEDYWDDHWPTVEAAFREMKELRANVARIHLQSA